ncbi:hypothetical protein IMY05_008G0065400 [Salix suchowensis]|nr:hypothetical protein IMY05_008G0065400 [Salix suchowensis]
MRKSVASPLFSNRGRKNNNLSVFVVVSSVFVFGVFMYIEDVKSTAEQKQKQKPQNTPPSPFLLLIHLPPRNPKHQPPITPKHPPPPISHHHQSFKCGLRTSFKSRSLAKKRKKENNFLHLVWFRRFVYELLHR